MAYGFRVPLGRTHAGALVAPEDGRKGGAYACPACGSRLSLHAGEKKRRHFHHLAGDACSSETALHAAAKQLVAAAVDEHVLGSGPSPVFVRRCAAACDATCRQELPRKVGGARLEARLASGRVVDVGLFARAAPALFVAAIEIHVTHAVDDDKALDVEVPWIEVEAEEVCESRGRVLRPTRDRFVPWLCDRHAGERGAAVKEAREERRLAGDLARRLPFALGDFPGFRVARVATCASGHDALELAWDGDEPPWPRPPCVVAVAGDLDRRFAGGAVRRVLPYKRRYVSVCPRCNDPLLPRPVIED
jgi:Competence protein CoiA-like family